MKLGVVAAVLLASLFAVARVGGNQRTNATTCALELRKAFEDSRYADSLNATNALEAVLEGPSCGWNSGAAAYQKQIVTFLRYPSWFNGFVAQWLQGIRNDPAASALTEHLVFGAPNGLPPLGSFSSAISLKDYMVVQEDKYTVTSADLSGLPTSVVWARLSAMQTAQQSPENACVERSDPRGVMQPQTYLLTYYRRDALDLLHQRGVIGSPELPGDWDGLIALLAGHKAAVAAGGSGGARLPQYGLCVLTHPECGRLGDLWAAVAASVIQANGTYQGYVYDTAAKPSEARPMSNSAGWLYASEIVRQLMSYNAPDVDANGADLCSDNSPLFSKEFSCMITFNWDIGVLTGMNMTALEAQGYALGVGPLPGSRRVLDRRPYSPTAGAVVPCSPELCGLSANHDALYLSPRAATVAGARGLDLSAPEPTLQPTDVPLRRCDGRVVAAQEAADVVAMLGATPDTSVNRAPYGATLHSLVRFVSLPPTPGFNASSVQLVGDIIERRVGQEYSHRLTATNAARAALGFAPTNWSADPSRYVRMRWWTALASPFNTSTFAAAGVPDDAAQSLVRAAWHALHSPNAATDPTSPIFVNFIKWALGEAGQLLEASNTNASAAADASNLLFATMIMVNDAFGNEFVRNTYSEAIDAVWTPPPPPEQGTSSRSNEGKKLGAILGSVLGALAVALAAAYVVVRMRRRNRDLLGRVVAPRAGPDTTLLCTDIQNSTRLWEELSVPTMDLAVKLHHGTIRRLLSEHDGYECATEGDAFIVAFRHPSTALAFAGACQLALMQEAWPEELLAHPDGCVVTAEVRDSSALDGLNRTPCSPRSTRALSSGWRPLCAVASLWDRLAHAPPPQQAPEPAEDDLGQHSLYGLKESNGGAGEDRSRGPRGFPNSVADDTGSASPAAAMPIEPLRSLAADSGSSKDTFKRLSDLPEFPTDSRRTLDSADRSSSASSAAGFPLSMCASWGKVLAAALPTTVVSLSGGAGSQPGTPSHLHVVTPSASSLRVRSLKGACGMTPATKKLLVFRGMRVRMGLHSGLPEGSFVTFNKVNSTFQYSGPFSDVAKLVSDAAPGGLVLLSGAAFARLRSGESGVSHKGGAPVVIYAGHHVLKEPKPPTASTATTIASNGGFVAVAMALGESVEAEPGPDSRTLPPPSSTARLARILVGGSLASASPQPPPSAPQPAFPTQAEAAAPDAPLFLATPAALLCRFACSAPMRTLRQTQTGTLDAPTGTGVTIAFLKVVGASTLLADLPGPATRAIESVQRMACGLLGAAGGYLVEGGDGLVLAAFGSPLAGLEWALDVMERLRGLAWEEELLSHELCEEVVTVGVPNDSSTSGTIDKPSLAAQPGYLREQLARSGSVRIPAATRRTREVGLRLKCGLAMGSASYSLTVASGRLSYRGKVMNRAARIAGVAAAGQVLCSGIVWETATAGGMSAISRSGIRGGTGKGLVGLSLGRVALKGISSPLEVIQVVRAD